MTNTLKYLPLGSIKPDGFVREQLVRNKHGMGGILPFIEPEMIADPYIRKTKVNASEWGDNQAGWGAEISGSYYCNLAKLAYTLGDADLIKQFEDWAEALLSKRREDGYLGTYDSPTADIYEDFNAWGNTQGMKALLCYYEATGKQEAFDAVYECMKWFTRNWAGDKKTSYAGIYITEPMTYCYRVTGDKALLDFCTDYQEYLAEHDWGFSSYKQMLSDSYYYTSQHTVAYCALMHLSALVYECNGDEVMLRAAINGVDKLNAKSMHVTGSPVSVNEYLGPVSSTHESEHCNYLRYPEACSQMARVTGEALYGDMIERTIFNGAQGARKKDERAIAYLSSPNQIYATRESTPTLSDYQSYSPCHAVSCCPVNSVGVIPEFVRTSVMTDGNDGLYFLTYCPGTVNYKGVSVKVDTVYPFADTVKLDVEGKTRLHLRRPGFCTDMTVTVNGESICSEADERGYVGVDVTDRAEVVIAFTFKTEIIRVDDSDGADKSPIAFLRGPLVFALPIEGRWNEIYPRGTEGLYGQWPTFNVTPVFNEVPVKDHYEKILRRKYQTCWNVCIDESIKASDLTLNMNEVVGYPWENPPVTLTVPAYRAPFLNSPYPAKTFEHFGKTLQRGEEMTVTLVPYGCTNLRITYFPRADKK